VNVPQVRLKEEPARIPWTIPDHPGPRKCKAQGESKPARVILNQKYPGDNRGRGCQTFTQDNTIIPVAEGGQGTMRGKSKKEVHHKKGPGCRGGFWGKQEKT